MCPRPKRRGRGFPTPTQIAAARETCRGRLQPDKPRLATSRAKPYAGPGSLRRRSSGVARRGAAAPCSRRIGAPRTVRLDALRWIVVVVACGDDLIGRDSILTQCARADDMLPMARLKSEIALALLNLKSDPNGPDLLRGRELVPGIAAVVDDVVEGFEDPVRESFPIIHTFCLLGIFQIAIST